MSPYRHLERFAREDGIKNPEDIYDQPTFEEIRQEIEKKRPNVRELLDERTLSPEQKACLDKTREFCNELSENFRSEFLSLLERYRSERRQISQEIVDYLLEKNFDLPQFTVSQGRQANELLADFSLDAEVKDRNLLLAFQFPKPLAHFWWKGGVDSWGDLGEDMEDRVIEWGHFYRELIREVWNLQGCYENEENLAFRRLNGIGEHDPGNFYYVWEMSRWEQAKNPNLGHN